jgi:hypothetical protein
LASSNARHYESFDQELDISSQHYVTSTDVSALGPWRDVSFDSLVDMHAGLLHTSESSPTLATSIAGADTLHRLAVAFAVWSKQVIQLCGEQARRMAQILQDVSNPFIPGSQRALIDLRKWLDYAPQAHRFRQGAICLLVKLAATSGELPGSLFKDGIRIGNSRDPTFSGGNAEIFRGTFEGQAVALKRPRVIDSDTTSDPRAVSRILRQTHAILRDKANCITARVSGITPLASANSPLHPPIHWCRQANVQLDRSYRNCDPLEGSGNSQSLHEIRVLSSAC